jgi:hypothetical protein
MTDDPIQAAIDSIANLPADTITLAVVADQKDAGAVGQVLVDVGKPGGWVTGAQGKVTVKSGWSFAALARWTKGK